MSADAPTGGDERTPCSPCRGTGTVVSNLGGHPSEVPCPWCDGTGAWPGPEHDAQAARRPGVPEAG